MALQDTVKRTLQAFAGSMQLTRVRNDSPYHCGELRDEVIACPPLGPQVRVGMRSGAEATADSICGHGGQGGDVMRRRARRLRLSYALS